MNHKLLLLLLVTLTTALGCSSKHEHEEVKEIKVNTFPKEIAIPKVFLQKIEADLLAESKVLNPVYLFIPLKVLFTQKTHGTLVSEALPYDFPKGGGTIDMQTVVAGQGSFYFSFPGEQFKELPELEHLFYVSQSPVTKVDGENYGLGCGKWIDLKKNFASFQKKDFIQANTTKNRHLFVLAGSYIFVFRKLNQIFITQVTLTDSKFGDQLCPQVAPELQESKL